MGSSHYIHKSEGHKLISATSEIKTTTGETFSNHQKMRMPQTIYQKL